MGNVCVGVLSVVCMILALAAAVMVTIAMVIVLKLRHKEKAIETKRKLAIGRWNKIIDSTLAWKKR